MLGFVKVDAGSYKQRRTRFNDKLQRMFQGKLSLCHS